MYCRLTPLIFSSLLLVACGPSPQRSSERIGVIVFENLSSDRSLDWVGHAFAGVIAAQSAGSGQTLVAARNTLGDAQNGHATHTLHGYFTGDSGNIHLRAALYDEPTRRVMWSVAESGGTNNFLHLADTIARKLNLSVRPYTTASETAAREFFRSETAGNPADALRFLDAAIAADPRFGAAHLRKLELLLRTDRAQAEAALEKPVDLNLRPYEQARLALLRAELDVDGPARLSALTRMAELQDGSADLWQSIAEGQMTAGQYRAAAEACGRGLALEPSHEALLNTRGYAFAYAGDSTRAVEAVTQYKSLHPASANASDSLGEIHFYFGRYEEAARMFIEASRQDPALLGGAEIFRAAFATFLAGDITRADKLLSDYLEDLRRRRDSKLELRLKTWRRLTGRVPGAPAQSSPEHSTFALWALTDGDRATAQKLAQSAAASATPEARNAASTAMFLAQTSAASNVWSSRAGSALPRPDQTDARERLLGWALLLDGKYAEAAKVWQSIYARSPGLARNDEMLALVWALTGAGQIDAARRVMPYGAMPPSVLSPGLEMLLYERLPGLRKTLKTAAD